MPIDKVRQAGLDNGELVAWVCLLVGVVLVLFGAYQGWLTSTKGSKGAEREVAGARTAIEAADDEVARAHSMVASPDMRAASPEAAGDAMAEATAKAKGKTEAAKSAIEQIGGIVASLPENLRFSGTLVLVGALLMSVATVQFGGTSLF